MEKLQKLKQISTEIFVKELSQQNQHATNSW